MTRPVFEVLNPGLFSCFQDSGRHGLAHLGVTSSGAFDTDAAALANRAVGNTAGNTVVETMLGGLELRALRTSTVTITGTHAPLRLLTSESKERNEHTYRVITLNTGDTLRIGQPTRGLRSYLAVRGGVHTESILGSCSYDTMSQIGPPPLSAGDILYATEQHSPSVPTHELPLPALPAPARISVIPGPRDDWFTQESIDHFYTTEFSVSEDSNRVGIRLHSPIPLERIDNRELPSEGMVKGSIQIPPSGHPVIFGPDHPTTGGYPVIGVVSTASFSSLAQLTPGAKVRFSRI